MRGRTKVVRVSAASAPGQDRPAPPAPSVPAAATQVAVGRDQHAQELLAAFNEDRLAVRELGADLRQAILARLIELPPMAVRGLVATERARTGGLSAQDLAALRADIGSIDVAGLANASLDTVPVWFDGPRAPTDADIERARRVTAGSARTLPAQLPDPFTNAQLAVEAALRAVVRRHGFAPLTLDLGPIPRLLADRIQSFNDAVQALATAYDRWRQADVDSDLSSRAQSLGRRGWVTGEASVVDRGALGGGPTSTPST